MKFANFQFQRVNVVNFGMGLMFTRCPLSPSLLTFHVDPLIVDTLPSRIGSGSLSDFQTFSLF